MRPRLRSVEFRREREAAWHELEILVAQVEKKGLRSLTADDARRLPTLYRGTLSALSVARAISLDRNVVDYLEGLCARAYLSVYGTKRRLSVALGDFFLRWVPQTMRGLRWPLLLSAVFMLSGLAAGFLLVLGDMDLFYTFVGDMAQGRSPASTTAALRDALYDDGRTGSELLAAFASFLFTHNAKIGMAAFGLGFAVGLPVFYLLFYNGLVIGGFAALYHSRGLSLELWAWLLPHGVTELFAVVVCGAAGLVLAHAILFPGRHSRLENLAIRGRLAAGIVLFAVVMFFVAGLIEGIFRQVVTDVTARYAMAAATLVFWIWYLGFFGRAREAAP